jgi:hypothetical protein
MNDRPTDVSYELGGINKQLEAITRTLSENRSADAQYRTGIRSEMAAQSAAIGSVGTDLALAKKDISDMKPKVESLSERATMSRGAAMLATTLGKVGHVIIAGIGGIIALLLERWLRGSPH